MTIRRTLLLAFLLFSVLFAASMALLAYTRSRAALDASAAVRLSEARFDRLAGIFRQATRLEADFWQMGLTRAD